MNYKVYSKSIIGTRKNQQDSHCAEKIENELVAVVCDGMGEISSSIKPAEDTVCKLIELVKAKDKKESVPSFLLRVIDILDENLVNLQRKTGEKKIGTTISAVLINENFLHLLSVGDSRVYFIQGDEMFQATNDHNVEYMMNNYADYSSKSVRKDSLVSFIGVGGIKYYDLNEVPYVLSSGDKILITSDGITKVLNSRQMITAINQGETETALDRLFDMATRNCNKGQDNSTCILIDVQ